jgi:DNA-binding winged helix-turn-helix (wHTH) protein/TolB-like protein/Flp pilus assembly protein TadD
MDKPAQHFYEFGPFSLDASRRRLLRAGEVVPLTPKAFDTLLALVEQSGRVVEKDDLMERVWPGVAVEENNLTQNVSALRKALGERREQPQYIATVPGLGYRFIAAVSESRPFDADPAHDERDAGKTQTGRNGFEAAVVELQGPETTANGEGTSATAANAEAASPNAANTEGTSANADASNVVTVNASSAVGALNSVAASSAGVASSAVVTASIEGAASAWRGRTAHARRGRLALAAAVIVVALAAGVYYLLARRARRTEAVAAGAQVRSIAVLPFKSLGADEPDQYLGLGMADALITKLSSIHQINVRPTGSIIRYAGAAQDPSAAGRELGVDTVLDGRVQKSGERIRVTVQLVRALDGAPLWGDTFDEMYTDIFTVEDRISEQVARALIPTLTGEQRQQLSKHYTEDTAAYQSYIKGRYYWNKRTADDLRKSVSYFEDAIIEDPNYALAYAGLADAYSTLGVLDDLAPNEIMPKARSAALKALELDDDLAEAHASLGYVKHRYEWDWAGAEREFRRAIELKPGYATAHQWFGWYLVSLGKTDEAVSEFSRAQELDPLSLYTNLTMGAPYFFSRQYERAAEQYRKVVEMNPDFWLAHFWLSRAYEAEGRYDESLAELQKVLKNTGGNTTEIADRGYVYAASGRAAEARAALAELQQVSQRRYVSPYGIAEDYAGLGRDDEAFEWMGKALKVRDNTLVLVGVDPRLDPLRSDARFAQLVKGVGLPQ